MAGLPFNPSSAPVGTPPLNVGFSYSGAPPAASGIPGMVVDFAARPNNYVGLNSFVSVANHFVTINNVNDDMSAQNCRDLGLGMLVFVRETTQAGTKNSRKMKARYGIDLGRNTVEMKELSQLNAYLQKHSADYASAAEVVAEWRLMGVTKSEAAPTNKTYGTAAVSRIVNLVVSHRVAVLNYWINYQIVQTQKMYMIVTRSRANNAWQVTPWTSANYDYPSLKDLVTSDDRNVKTLGAVIYVGKSADYVHASQAQASSALSTDFSQFFVKHGLMNQIDIQLGI